MSITDSLPALLAQHRKALDAGGVKELCDGYAKALKADPDATSEWMSLKLWPKLRPLFHYVEDLIKSRNDIQAQLERETDLVLENARKYEAQLKRSDELSDRLRQVEGLDKRQEAKIAELENEVIGLKLARGSARAEVESLAAAQRPHSTEQELRTKVRSLTALVKSYAPVLEAYLND